MKFTTLDLPPIREQALEVDAGTQFRDLLFREGFGFQIVAFGPSSNVAKEHRKILRVGDGEDLPRNMVRHLGSARDLTTQRIWHFVELPV